MVVNNIELMKWLAKGNGIAKNDGSELPVWCHAITSAGKFTENEIDDVSAKLANLGYKIHDAH